MTEWLSGKREIFAYGKESSYGTAVTPTVRLGNNVEFTPSNETDWQENNFAGSGDITTTYEVSNNIIRGSLKFVPQNWEFLTFVYGTTTNTGSSPTTHTFADLSDKSIPSFTLERAIQASTDSVRTYEGFQVNACNISWNVTVATGGRDNFVNVELDLVGEDVTHGTSTTSLTAISESGFQARHVLLTLNSVEVPHLISGSMSITNALSDGRFAYYNSSSANKGESQPQKRTFAGQFVMLYDDATEFNFWKNRVVVPGTNTLTFRRGTDDDCVFTFTNLRVVDNSDATNLDGFNRVTINWIADNVTAVATDSDSGYIT
jgi:hypothetical protein